MLNAPNTPDCPSFDAVDAALRRAEAAIDAAESHGTLCGLVCGLGHGGESTWIAETLSGARVNTEVAKQAGAVLSALAVHSRRVLEEADMSFQPLLPADTEPLAERVDGLAQWCQGFNHGLFVAVRIGDAEVELNADTTAEVLRDFGELAQAAVGDDQTEIEGEAAYAELVEYVRVSVQLIYEEFSAVRQRVMSAGRH